MADKDTDEGKEKEIKVDKWDSSAVRNALEDATKEFFNNQDDFTEDFTLFDIKLVLCTVACLFSLYALLYDYFIAPMPDSWPVLLVCSVSLVLILIFACDSMAKKCFTRKRRAQEAV